MVDEVNEQAPAETENAPESSASAQADGDQGKVAEDATE